MNLMASALGIILQKFKCTGLSFLSFYSTFNSCSWEHGFCVSCPLLPPLLPLRRKQQNHLGVATSSPALPKEEQSHVRGTVTSHQT